MKALKVFAAVLLVSGTAWARTPYLIRFKSTPIRPHYDHSHTTAQIEALWTSRYHSPMMHNPGLTMAEHELQTSYRFEGRQPSNGGASRIWVSVVDVTFQLTKLDVYLSNKYRVGTCQYKVILGHENQHVAINQKEVAKYKALMLRALQSARDIPSKARPLVVTNVEQGKAQISAQIDHLLFPLYERFKQEVAVENGKIDTLANYRRTQALCRDW